MSDSTITDLPFGGTIRGNDLIPVDRDNVTMSVKLQDYIKTFFSDLTAISELLDDDMVMILRGGELYAAPASLFGTGGGVIPPDPEDTTYYRISADGTLRTAANGIQREIPS